MEPEVSTVQRKSAAGGDDVHREDRAARSTAPDPGAGHHASDLAGRVPDVRESRALGPMMAAAEQVRGLRFLRPVPTRIQTRAEITKLHQQLATTFIYVTHDQTEAMTMGTRIAVQVPLEPAPAAPAVQPPR
jgi:hypothetical protein